MPPSEFPVGSLFDMAVRKWLADGRQNEMAWQPVESEIRKRAVLRARAHLFPPDDVDDVVSEAAVNMLLALNSPAAASIRSFDTYLGTVVENACRCAIRRCRPVWACLKSELMEYVRGRRGTGAISGWKQAGRTLVGLMEWSGQPIEWTPHYLLYRQDCAAVDAGLAGAGDLQAMPLDQLSEAVLHWMGTPIPVNELTSICCRARALREANPEDFFQEDMGVEERVLLVERAQSIARLFTELDRDRLAALLFHLDSDVAEKVLFHLGEQDRGLLLARLGVDEARLPETLGALPWRDLEISRFLGIQRDRDLACQMRVAKLRRQAIRAIQQGASEA
jgi:hypothetical protein